MLRLRERNAPRSSRSAQHDNADMRMIFALFMLASAIWFVMLSGAVAQAQRGQLRSRSIPTQAALPAVEIPRLRSQ